LNTFSVSRLTLALAFGVTLTACSSTPPDQQPSQQTAPGTASRPILTAGEAKNFVAANYFARSDAKRSRVEAFAIRLPAG
jgi:pectinesterase